MSIELLRATIINMNVFKKIALLNITLLTIPYFVRLFDNAEATIGYINVPTFRFFIILFIAVLISKGEGYKKTFLESKIFVSLILILSLLHLASIGLVQEDVSEALRSVFFRFNLVPILMITLVPLLLIVIVRVMYQLLVNSKSSKAIKIATAMTLFMAVLPSSIGPIPALIPAQVWINQIWFTPFHSMWSYALSIFPDFSHGELLPQIIFSLIFTIVIYIFWGFVFWAVSSFTMKVLAKSSSKESTPTQ